jgi:hypothetical protein|tara:strand:+ start:1738 stop:1935 length:198 start_codon:yes stop_codon:yes gene_type:complete
MPKERISIQLKTDIENIQLGFICIEGKDYEIPPAITACIMDMLNEIENLQDIIDELKNSDIVARS